MLVFGINVDGQASQFSGRHPGFVFIFFSSLVVVVVGMHGPRTGDVGGLAPTNVLCAVLCAVHDVEVGGAEHLAGRSASIDTTHGRTRTADMPDEAPWLERRQYCYDVQSQIEGLSQRHVRSEMVPGLSPEHRRRCPAAHEVVGYTNTEEQHNGQGRADRGAMGFRGARLCVSKGDRRVSHTAARTGVKLARHVAPSHRVGMGCWPWLLQPPYRRRPLGGTAKATHWARWRRRVHAIPPAQHTDAQAACSWGGRLATARPTFGSGVKCALRRW